MYTFNTTVRLYDTDGAGLLFFGNHFRLAHETYEVYLDTCGLNIGKIVREGMILLPIIQAKADYTEMVFTGDDLRIEMTAANVSAHSYVLDFNMFNQAETKIGTVRTVHVCLDGKTHEKIDIPDDLKAALEALR